MLDYVYLKEKSFWFYGILKMYVGNMEQLVSHITRHIGFFKLQSTLNATFCFFDECIKTITFYTN